MYTKILFCTDFSEASQQSLAKAAAFAAAFNAELHLCHVVHPVASVAVHGYYYPFDVDLEKKVFEAAEESMATLKQTYNLPQERCHVFFGEPKLDILDLAVRQNIDLLMVGGHHHSILGQLGSVANALMSHAECPVLIMSV